MSAAANKLIRFVTSQAARVELAPWGKHWWLSEPGLTETTLLTLVRVTMRPGTGHRFHYHPTREEIIYVLDGVAEQWVDREKQRLRAGESAFIPKRIVHAIYNSSRKPMTFLAILSPAKAKGPFLVDCYEDEPWRSLRAGTGSAGAERLARRGKPAGRRRIRGR
jgi:quercetin dioxygenase-like cupin family protein